MLKCIANFFASLGHLNGEQGLAHWCERLPPTSVAQLQFWPGPYVDWACSQLSRYSEGFSLHSPVSHSPSTKNHYSKFQFNQYGGPALNQLRPISVASSLNIVNCLFIGQGTISIQSKSGGSLRAGHWAN